MSLPVDPSKKEDAYYRYKMPPLNCKVEGKGNGIKTVVLNVAEVAAILKRSPDYIMKYMSVDIGVSMKMEGERWVLTGDHVKPDAMKLQGKLYEFITKGVLCKSCRNPETVYVIEKGKLMMRCKACSLVTDTTLPDRVTTGIIKAEAEMIQSEQSKDEKQEAKWKSQLRHTSGAEVEVTTEEETGLHRGDPTQILSAVVDSGVGESTIVDKVFDLKQEFGMQEKDMAKVVFRTYFQKSNAANACMTIRQCANVLKRFTGPELHNTVMEEAEHYAHRNKEVMFPKFPIFLFELVERGIISETTILNWHESGKSKGLEQAAAAELRIKCDPFITLVRKNVS